MQIYAACLIDISSESGLSSLLPHTIHRAHQNQTNTLHRSDRSKDIYRNFVPFSMKDLTYRTDPESIPAPLKKLKPITRFKPHFGWRDHIELAESPLHKNQ